MRVWLYVTCSKCKQQGSVQYICRDCSTKPSAEDAASDTDNWTYTKCNKSGCGGTLQLKKAGGKQLVTLTQKVGHTFGPLRPERTRKKAAPRGEFVDSGALDAELGADASLEDLEDDPSDPTIKKPSTHFYKGALSRLNTTAYPSGVLSTQAVGGLKEFYLQRGARIGDSAARGGQGPTMSAHYRENGPLAKKTYIRKLLFKRGGIVRSLSATLFAEAFMENDPALQGVFDDSDRHHTMEWCHALACCLGGDSGYENLFSASFDANTFSAALEDWLRWNRSRRELYMWLAVYYESHNGDYSAGRTSCRRAPKVFRYGIARDASKAGLVEFDVDCRAIGFNRADYDLVISTLNTAFAVPMNERGL